MEAIVTERAKLYPAEGTMLGPVGTVADANTALSSGVPRWYAASTRSRHEKFVFDQLQLRAIECYLPLSENLRQWHDRKKRVSMPALPGYLFVRIPLADRLRVLQVPGLTRLVGFNTGPTPLQDEEIERLRTALTSRNSEPHPYLTSGTPVQIAAGPLQGLKGIVQRRGRDLRLIVSVDFVCRAVAVELNEGDLELAA